MLYTVAFWQGGSQVGQWNKCLPVETREKADAMAEEIVCAGRPAYVYETKFLAVVGLPDDAPPTWDFERLEWRRHVLPRGSITNINLGC